MTTIAHIQASVDFLFPRERVGCQNCEHVIHRPEGSQGPYARGRWECGRYGFYTAPLSICREHSPQPALPQLPGAEEVA